MNIIYSFIDESGQHTRGQYFVVSVIVSDDLVEQMTRFCAELEASSRKGKVKWGKAQHKARMNYMNEILKSELFNHQICFGVYKNTKEYDRATINTVKKSLELHAIDGKYTNIVYVDGLSRTKAKEYKKQIRKEGLPIKRVAGIAKDENNALIRLADAIAGFIADVQGESTSPEIQKLYQKGIKSGHLVDIREL